MTDATTAAKAIQAWHSGDASELGGRTVNEAGVVLARLNEAITHLEAIRDLYPWAGPADDYSPKVHAVAALACLRNEDEYLAIAAKRLEQLSLFAQDI